ncbi:hypothetical protein H5410_044109 [Solanum commersonii]|uniref:Uncharacterized protein n=1 Tax=Solanum commersonii TaxID=4109 RepID=A0A9J5XZ14_SOLCO|nr:hypothetical protein H5410_044109 [Solanum commersonii]
MVREKDAKREEVILTVLTSIVATVKRRSEGTNRMGSEIPMWLFDFCSLLYANLMMFYPRKTNSLRIHTLKKLPLACTFIVAVVFT